jgi:hypothetical protein
MNTHPFPFLELALAMGLSVFGWPQAVRADETPIPADFKWKGDVQMQGVKNWSRGWGGDNLDVLWGRLNFGGEFKESNFSSKFNVRIFPEGFGFEPIVGATYDTSGQGTLKVKTSEQARVLINHAWVKQEFSEFAIRVGRFETRQTPSYIYGDYIDLPSGASFGSRVAVHNAAEITAGAGGVQSSLILGTSDKNLNKGFLRIYESWTHAAGLTLVAGLRSNIFDKIYDVDADLLNRVVVSASYADPAKWGFFLEAALLQKAKTKDEFPVLGGVYFPGGFVANKISVEAEFVPDRTFSTGDDRPVVMAVYGQKKVFQRVTFDAGVFSDPSATEFMEMGTALRFTCTLK